MFELDGPPPQEASPTPFNDLTTEVVRGDLRGLDAFSTLQIAELMNDEDRTVPDAIRPLLPVIGEVIDEIAARMSRGGRLIYVGAGTPGRIGVLDASECPPTFNTDPGLVVGLIAGGSTAIQRAVEGAEDDTHAAVADLDAIVLHVDDSVIGLSASGRTPYVASALRHARRRGALTVAIACNDRSVIGTLADHAIEVVVGPEVIAGSTRLKAGTAQKLVLNMISTITMVRLGKTLGNVMVDLQATNEKLRARAQHAVMLVTGRSADECASALVANGGSVKAAILMLSRGISPTRAAELLAATPSLRAALQAIP